MGYLKPTALVVTALYSYGGEGPRRHWVDVAREAAVEIFERVDGEMTRVSMGEPELSGCVGEVVRSPWNDSRSFLVAWDGSKEGWAPSAAGDRALEEYVGWLREQAYGDGSSPLHWVWVRYGGDDGWASVLASSHMEPVPADEVDALRWAVVELAGHVHDCEELLSPRSRRVVSEVRALQLSRLAEPACPRCGMTSQVEPSRSEPGRWMCHGCAQPFDGPEAVAGPGRSAS